MTKFKYALYDGAIYKKVKESRYTYVYGYSVKSFIQRILGNPEAAEQIHGHVSSLIGMLSEKSSRLIKPMEIDFDYIECLNGYCFSISKKCFIKNPPLEKSPRAFVRYTYDGNVPYPQYFIQGKIYFFVFNILRPVCFEKIVVIESKRFMNTFGFFSITNFSTFYYFDGFSISDFITFIWIIFFMFRDRKFIPIATCLNELLSKILPDSFASTISNERKKINACRSSRQWKNLLVRSFRRYVLTTFPFMKNS